MVRYVSLGSSLPQVSGGADALRISGVVIPGELPVKTRSPWEMSPVQSRRPYKKRLLSLAAVASDVLPPRQLGFAWVS